MTELFHLEEHNSFESASRRARELARLTAMPASVRSHSLRWVVMARGTTQTMESLVCDRSAVATAPTDDDEMALVRQEVLDDQDDWARSEEDGWFYED